MEISDIAIIGMAGVFPGAANIQQYWENILHKVKAISDAPPEWEAELFFEENTKADDRTYCKRGGLLSAHSGYLTGVHRALSLKGMEVHLPESQEAQLNELAVKTGRETDELVREAVGRWLADSEWFQQQVQVGIDQINRGEFIEEEEMDARVERMLRS